MKISRRQIRQIIIKEIANINEKVTGYSKLIGAGIRMHVDSEDSWWFGDHIPVKFTKDGKDITKDAAEGGLGALSSGERSVINSALKALVKRRKGVKASGDARKFVDFKDVLGY